MTINKKERPSVQTASPGQVSATIEIGEIGAHDESRPVRTRYFLIVFAALTLAAAFVFWGVPLWGDNDGCWMYMNVHHLVTGQYIWDPGFPTFVGPCQYFPLGGYSLWLLGARELQDATAIPWPLALRGVQFAAYILSAYLVFAIASLLGWRRAGLAAVILYFIYFPLLNFARFVMSETLATLLVLVVAYGIIKSIMRDRPGWLYFAMFVAGYCILVKPVTAPLIAVAAGLVIFRERSKRPWARWALMIALAGVCPMAQSLTNKVLYGTYQIRSGFGWNLWNRVIDHDDCFPAQSDDGCRLMIRTAGVTKDGQFLASYQIPWWEACQAMSLVGYSRQETEDTCLRIALDGMSENKWKYVVNSFSLARESLFCETPLKRLYSSYGEHYEWQRRWHLSSQLPLTNALCEQERWLHSNAFNDLSLRTYCIAGSWFGQADRWGIQYVIGLGYLVCLLATIPVALRRRTREAGLLLFVMLIPIWVVFGSGLVETATYRYKLPVVPLMILGLCIAAEKIVAEAVHRIRRRGANS